jgi:hypothetical protein
VIDSVGKPSSQKKTTSGQHVRESDVDHSNVCIPLFLESDGCCCGLVVWSNILPEEKTTIHNAGWKMDFTHRHIVSSFPPLVVVVVLIECLLL